MPLFFQLNLYIAPKDRLKMIIRDIEEMNW